MPSDIAFNSGLASLDFGTGYILISLFPTIFLTFVATVNFAVRYLLSKVLTCDRFKKTRRNFKAELEEVYAFYIRLLIELSLEIGICSMVELSMRQTETPIEKFSFFVSLFALVGVIWFINQCDKLIIDNFYKINNEKFKKFNLMWGELWVDLKIIKDDKPRFNLIFMARRLVYAAIIVIPAVLGILPLIQMVMVIYLNLWLCKYLVEHRPFETKS